MEDSYLFTVAVYIIVGILGVGILLTIIQLIENFLQVNEKTEYRVTVFKQIKTLSTTIVYTTLYIPIFIATCFLIIPAIEGRDLLIIVVLILLILFLIYFSYEIIMCFKLYLQYLKNEKGRRIKCDVKNKCIHIYKGEEETILSEKNIINMMIQNASLGKMPSGSFEFIRIITNDRQEIYMTSLIINLFFIRDTLGYSLSINHPRDRHFCKLE